MAKEVRGMLSCAVVVPAYQPGPVLVQVVNGLLACGFDRLIVVNDGSDAASAPIFQALDEKVTLLAHPDNRGKGAALRTGLAHVWSTRQAGELGSVTLDADGQHRPVDAVAVAHQLQRTPGSLVLGVRDFHRPGVPFLRKLGNLVTCRLLAWRTGQRLPDTQTGLRAIPMGSIPDLLQIPDSGYEFELRMLMRHRHIAQVPIETLYGDSGSHFRALRDSLRILRVLLSPDPLASSLPRLTDRAASE